MSAERKIFKEPEEYVVNPVLRRRALMLVGGLARANFWRGKLEIHGLEKLAAVPGPVVVAPNHPSMLDIGLNAWMLDKARNREFVFVGKSEWWEDHPPILGDLFEALGGFPVDRQGKRPMHFSHMCKHVLATDDLVIYPQGECIETDIILPKDGAVEASRRSGVPIVPIGQYGTQHLLHPSKQKHTVAVVGDPIYPPELAGGGRKAEQIALNNALNQGMQEAYDFAKERSQALAAGLL